MGTDLVVLVPDKNMKFALTALLSRPADLEIRSVTSDIYVHVERDPGCFLKCDSFLRSFIRSHMHALVVFDREGCGREHQSRQQLESQTEEKLSRSGWNDRNAAVVLDPELESWVWSKSPQVARILDWEGRDPGLHDWLAAKGYIVQNRIKPSRPKEALEGALRIVRKPRSSSIYFQLARDVQFQDCADPSFLKLRDILSKWFI